MPDRERNIYISDGGKVYRLHTDYSQEEIDEKEFEAIQQRNPNSIVVFDKDRFLQEKDILLNKNHPFSIREEAAFAYFKMGFITKEELDEYVE